jgi:uncharacterized protein (TIGR02646 family)
LSAFILANPTGTWEELRNDNTRGSAHIYNGCLHQTLTDQHGLCAYCEQEISQEDALHRRIEHFHPKSDTVTGHNWALDWNNLLAVCDGGDRSADEERINYPLPGNSHCDASKGGKTDFILNPLDVPAFPNLFTYQKDTGKLMPDAEACAGVEIPGNTYEGTAALVSKTIDILNLNCACLNKKRNEEFIRVEQFKKILRERRIPREKWDVELCRRYFHKKWPKFFTMLRCCLGQTAEDYLTSINYQG